MRRYRLRHEYLRSRDLIDLRGTDMRKRTSEEGLFEGAEVQHVLVVPPRQEFEVSERYIAWRSREFR